MKRICIIGSGATGILLLLSFQRANISPKQITILDPYHDGGDLQRKWSNVRSNTLWKQILQAVPPSSTLAEPWCSLDPESPCELGFLIQYLWYCVRPYFRQCHIHTGLAESVTQDNETKEWQIKIKGQTKSIEADLLFLTIGSEPKTLDLPFPSIPLHVALDPTALSKIVEPGHHILLFGTAHSSTLIVRNLVQCGAKVTNFYATQKPFYFDRDGDYDGLKQDAADIADQILKGILSVDLISIHDVGGVIRATQKSVDAMIVAIGFEQRNTFGFSKYDGATGKLEGVTNGWGFGIAYPNRAPDGIHWDVSIPAFMAHIQTQMPDILSSLGIE